MIVERGLREGVPVDPVTTPAVVTIGSFDGVHRGHAVILDRVRAGAAELRAHAVVLTFDPHPRCVLRPESCPETLTTLDEKAELLGDAGIHRLLVLPFDIETSRWSAERFLQRLAATVGLRRLVVGPDFAFGHGRQGGLDFLRDWGSARGIELEVVEPVILDGERVSSSRIRAAVASGDVEDAARLAGRWHFVDAPGQSGVHRDDQGRAAVGLAVPGGKALPASGIYATWVRAAGRWRMAATSIGAPTLDGGRIPVECHPIELAGDLHSETVRCAFVARLPDERAAARADRPTAAQVGGDLAQAYALLAGTAHP